MAIPDLKAATPQTPIRIGRYDVIGLISEGGMGTVYDAIDREHGGHVALKTLHHIAPERLLLFKNEFRSVADLSHKNLVPLYELSRHEDLWFFTMERIQGVGLLEWLRTEENNEGTALTVVTAPTVPASHQALSTKEPNQPPEEPKASASTPACNVERFVSVMGQLLDALDYLHQQGIVHQDLKPSNVLVEQDGTVRLLDLGLASRIGQSITLLREGSVIGTPAYMSPEQWRGKPATSASDLYALGCMMFQLLTGQLPFMSKAALTRLPPRVERRVQGVPKSICDICYKLLARAPSDRPSSAEVREALGLSAPSPSEGVLPASGFVGRQAEREALHQALHRAQQGASAIVRVSGSSGVGKTALLRSFFRELRAQGALLLRGRCYEQESVPYKAFDGIIDELAVRLSLEEEDEVKGILPQRITELSKVFPVLASIPAVASRLEALEPISALELKRRVLEGLRQLFERLAARRPVAIEIDDLQWADADSAALLQKLSEGRTPNGLLLAVSLRPKEAQENPAIQRYLETLSTQEEALSISIGPLPPNEAKELAQKVLSSLQVPQDLSAAIAEESGGVPFFIEELAHFAAQKREAGEELSTSGLSLERVLAERVRSLPEEARALVEVLSVANNPIPLFVSCQAASIESGALPILQALRRGRFVQSAGVRAEDRVEIYHDRMRESVLAYLPKERLLAHHLALGRALVKSHEREAPGPWIFDAVRHLAEASLSDPLERLSTARLSLTAGRRARQAAAFPLAFSLFERGIALLPKDAWESEYELALGLYSGAAEAAYLSANWETLNTRISQVKSNSRTAMDQLTAWEVQIDACAGRHQYVAAVDAAMQALALFGVRLPKDPSESDIRTSFQRALEALTQIGPEGLSQMPDADDPQVLAAMRIQLRVSPVAYFGKPSLLPIIASNLITTSIERGLSPATPYALALFGIVLNTQGMHPVSHPWGQLAVRLLERWKDPSVEAATRHVVFNLVCSWMVPLHTVLAPLREVFDIGRRTGDLEYASYAAHGYVHNALYAGRPLGPLLEEALELGRQMRALGQVNAVHVHAPFEQLLKCLTGRLPAPPSLNDEAFQEEALLEAAAREGSRSGIYVLRVVMGLSRFYFGEPRAALESLEIARQYLDAAPSVWHIPMMHQFAALSACALFRESDEGERARLRATIETSLEALRAFAQNAPINFAHRVSLLEGELQRSKGRPEEALAHFARATQEANEANWINDIALSYELSANCLEELGKIQEAKQQREAAYLFYQQWGAFAKASQLIAQHT